MKKLLALASALGVLAIVSSAQSAKADGLFTNTGTNLGAANVDKSYSFIQLDSQWKPGLAPSDATINAAIAAADAGNTWKSTYKVTSAFPGTQWVANDSSSSWVAPSATYKSWSSDSQGFYLFKTTIDLTGKDVTTAAFSGAWNTDNEGDKIFVNTAGNDAVLAGAPGNKSYADASWKTNNQFVFLGTFNEGVNTAYFLVHNEYNHSGNPVGLRVDATVAAAPVPEPAFVQLGVLLTSGGLMVIRKRRA